MKRLTNPLFYGRIELRNFMPEKEEQKMEWISVEEKLPEKGQLCVVACNEWDVFEENWCRNVNFRILEYIPKAGIWNIKKPLNVLAWIPIPEFHIVPESPPQLEGRLCMSELEEKEEHKQDIDFFEALSRIIREAREREEKAREEICTGSQQLQSGNR